MAEKEWMRSRETERSQQLRQHAIKNPRTAGGTKRSERRKAGKEEIRQ